jgi:hypothetical protein
LDRHVFLFRAITSGILNTLSAGVIISTVQNPISFDNFTSNGQQQIVGPFAHEEDAGIFCMPLDLSDDNITGVEDGANVTIQVR